jgi:uncharacterized protein (DUF2384 family)
LKVVYPFPVTFAEQLVSAFRNDLAERALTAARLELVEEEIAKAAFATFEGGLGASNWLTTPSIVFAGRSPLDVSNGEGGKAQVLLALARIDRGLAV